MERWNHHPDEEGVVSLALENSVDKSHIDGQENDETKLLVKITGDDDHPIKDESHKEGQENDETKLLVKITGDDDHPIKDESHKEGQENDETKLLVRLTCGDEGHSLEQMTSPLSSRLPCNDHKEMNLEQCAECSLIKDLIRHSPESTIFWQTVKTGPFEGGCHQKYMAHLLTALDEYASDPCIEDEKTIALLKQLLRVDQSAATAKVEFSNFARLVQYYGPVRRDNCIMVKQIHHIAQKSSVFTNKIRKETVSWFAGDMTRDMAESLLVDRFSGTYLVRMSQTFPGYFVVSVTSEGTVYHIVIEADVARALRSEPYHANLRLHGLVYPSLVEAAQSLKTRILETEDGLEIMCRKCCPNLAINAIISGYRKSTKRR